MKSAMARAGERHHATNAMTDSCTRVKRQHVRTAFWESALNGVPIIAFAKWTAIGILDAIVMNVCGCQMVHMVNKWGSCSSHAVNAAAGV